MAAFELDGRLAEGSVPVARLGLCLVRLVDDRRWPWLTLVPQRAGAAEFHDLSPLDQTMLTFELSLVSGALKRLTGAGKINIGMIGNRVPAFHAHVVARDPGDPNWPDPVWGFGTREPYGEGEAAALARRVEAAVLPS